MNVTLFSFRGALQITGLHFSWVQLSPLVFGCCSVIYLLAINAMTRRRMRLGNKVTKSWNMKSAWENMTSALIHLKKRGEKGKGWARFAAVWSVSFFCCILVIAASKLPKYNIVTEHNVAILAKLSNGDFAYRSTEEPEGGTYRICPIDKEHGINVDGMLTQAAKGKYIAEKATWEERGTCRSILKPEWQFWFRDEANNFTYRRVN